MFAELVRQYHLHPIVWRKLDGGWAYLHGSGALGTSGTVTGVETSLPAALAPFILPASPTGAELRSAIRASLAVVDLAPDRVTVPTLGAVWRSILGAADFSVFIYGATGRFKTALASLLQQHFGAGFAADRLPGSWASTANFNEVLAFIAKDALLIESTSEILVGGASDVNKILLVRCVSRRAERNSKNCRCSRNDSTLSTDSRAESDRTSRLLQELAVSVKSRPHSAGGG